MWKEQSSSQIQIPVVLPVTERLLREEARLRALQEIAEAVRSTPKYEDLLHLVMAKISSLMEADRATLYEFEEESKELVSRVYHGPNIGEIRLKLGEGIAGSVAQLGKALNLRDAYKDSRFRQDYDLASGYRTRSVLCVPLRDTDDHILGAIQVLNKKSGYFTTDDEKLLVALAAHAAVSIQISKLYHEVSEKNYELRESAQALHETARELQDKVKDLDLLYELEQQLANTPSTAGFIRQLLLRSADAVEARCALIATLEGNDFFFDLQYNPSLACSVRVSGQEPLLQDLLRTRTLLTDNKPKLPTCLAKNLHFSPNNALLVPLLDDKLLGVLLLLGKKEGFVEEDRKLATLLAGSAVHAILADREKQRYLHVSRLEDIGRLLSGIIHDLRGPMTVISGYSELSADEDSHQKRTQYQQVIQKQLNFIQTMTQELLAFAKGESKLFQRNVYVTEFVESLTTLLRALLEGRNIRLHIDTQYRGTARFDENKLLRAVYNLAQNAVQAMQNTGTLGIHVDTEEDMLVFCVSDTGHGVAPEIQDKLFEHFVTHGTHDGTGLGLSITKQIVEAHGGKITFVSEPNKGTTFCIKIPLGVSQP